MLAFLYCQGNDIVAVIEQDVYNFHFRTFYLSVERPEVNVTGTIYPTYTGIHDQLRGMCSYLTQHQTLAVFVVGNQESIDIVSMVTNVLGIPTLAYMKESKTVYEKVTDFIYINMLSQDHKLEYGYKALKITISFQTKLTKLF